MAVKAGDATELRCMQCCTGRRYRSRTTRDVTARRRTIGRRGKCRVIDGCTSPRRSAFMARLTIGHIGVNCGVSTRSWFLRRANRARSVVTGGTSRRHCKVGVEFSIRPRGVTAFVTGIAIRSWRGRLIVDVSSNLP